MLLMLDCTDAQLAVHLSIARATLKQHRKAIRLKMRVRTCRAAAALSVAVLWECSMRVATEVG